MMRSQAQPFCILCGSSGTQIYSNLSDRIFSAPGTWSLVRCERAQCGLIWLDPMPLQEDLGEAYKDYYTHGRMTLSAVRAASRVRSAYRALVKVGDALTGVARARKALDTMYLAGAHPARLLEVGCGNGALLRRMKARGWQVAGIDFDPSAVRQAAGEGLEVRCGDLLDQDYPSGHFDYIVMSHVIEHLSYPLDTLRRCRELLREDGKLIIATPNTGSWGHRTFRSRWRDLDPPRHLYLFSVDNLAQLAKEAGLEVISARSSAGRAEVVFAGCIEISESGRHDMQSPRMRPSLSVRSKLLQYFEQVLLQFDRHAGEEAVVIAGKASRMTAGSAEHERSHAL